ncbi:unnamed protein product [Rotaria sp. Silwood1]|nr:unnamed protein product [Rotaria sp. Silwood1]
MVGIAATGEFGAGATLVIFIAAGIIGVLGSLAASTILGAKYQNSGQFIIWISFAYAFTVFTLFVCTVGLLQFANNPIADFVIRNFYHVVHKSGTDNIYEYELLNRVTRPFTYIGNSEIDEGTVIHGNCFVFDNVKIGKNVSINAGSIIGSEGFGYELNEKNEYEKFIHIGGVEIHDNVDIGANTCVVRGALANTIIGEGTKIDNLVHIGHNAIIGKHCIITANNMVGGSVKIEDHSWLGPSSSTLNQLTLAKNSYAGLGSIITKNMPSGEVWVGNPARPIEEMKKLQEIFRDLLNEE